MIAFVVVSLLLVAPPPLWAEREKRVRIDLGGPRRATAELTVTAKEYRLRVRLLAVTAFDPATNSALNREKVRLLGLKALARHLSGERDVEFEVSGVEVEDAGRDGRYFTLRMRVPARGVNRVEEHDRAGRARPPAGADTNTPRR